jgi:hypothetical protein
MIMRLTRSLDRDTYFVDVGRSPIEEEIKILKRWKRALQRKTYVDPVAGRFDSKFDPYAWSESQFFPTKEGSQSRIEKQTGITNISDIADIDHFRDKFFGSLRAPKAYFGYEGEVNSKSSISSQSLKWARAVHSLQRGVKNGLKRLCQIQLAFKGLDTSADKFEVMMTAPSIVDLLDKLEAWQSVVDVAERMTTLGQALGLNQKDWNVYILENVLWLSKQEVKRFIEGMPESTPAPEVSYEPERGELPQDQEYEEPEFTAPPMAAAPSPLSTPKSPGGFPPREAKGNGKSQQLNLAEIDKAIRKVAQRTSVRLGERRE